MNKRYLPFPLFILSVFLVVAAGWYMFTKFAPTPTPVGINEVTPSGTVSLEVSPAPASYYLGDTATLDINAIFDPASEHLTAVQLELNYDADNLLITGLASTDYLPITLAAPAINAGTATATYGAPVETGGRTSWGTVAKMTVKMLGLGSYTISFGPNTLASGTTSDVNVLKSVSSIPITVVNRGDLNRDKIVNIFDFNELITHYGDPYTIFDFNDLVAHYGQTSP